MVSVRIIVMERNRTVNVTTITITMPMIRHAKTVLDESVQLIVLELDQTVGACQNTRHLIRYRGTVRVNNLLIILVAP